MLEKSSAAKRRKQLDPHFNAGTRLINEFRPKRTVHFLRQTTYTNNI